MNNLTAIKKAKEGGELAIAMFRNIWTKFMTYWIKVRPKDNITTQVLEIL